MTDIQQSTWEEWIGADVVDDSGTKIGSLTNIYMDRSTGQPEWLAVSTGMFGTKSSFVPISGAGADGDALRVPYAKDLVKDAPNVDEEDGYLEPDEEQRLYQHYGQSYEPWTDDHVDVAEGDVGGPGHDTSGPSTDSAMTRSEEELQVGTRSVEAGRVRLRKYVVTENVTTTVPVRKEKVRVEREPITDANIGDALDGPDISEEEHEVVLHEDQVVVGKETVPKERVRLDTDTVIEDQTVTDDVRKERIEVDDDNGSVA
ncbi:MAG: uncharacterized protein JWO77_3072 [Ilumatobacteraceae bacterium]|nr:uncharacterized protein [Ilumatobacteraceae bacterium]